MAATKTGRARGLTISGTLAGLLRVHEGAVGLFDIDGNPVPGTGSPFLVATCEFGLISPWGSLFTVAQCAPNVSGLSSGQDFGVTITGSTPWSAPETVTNYTHLSPPYDFTGSFDGTFTVSVDTEEWQEDDVAATFPGCPVDSTNAPIDPPFQTDHRVWDTTRIGGSYTMHVACGGATLDMSGTVTTETDLGTWIISFYGYGSAENIGNTAGIAFTFTWTDSGSSATGAFGDPGYSFTDVNTTLDGTVTVSETGVSVTVDCDPDLPTTFVSVFTVSGRGDVAASPPRGYTLDVLAQAMEDAYPDALTLGALRPAPTGYIAIGITGGVGSDNLTQHQFRGTVTHYDPSGTVTGVEAGPIADEWNMMQCWIMPASLTALNDDAAAWRVFLRGRAYASLTLTQAGSVEADSAPVAARYTAGPNTTLADGGGGLEITVGSGEGSLSTTLPAADAGLKGGSFAGVSFAGYRWLRIAGSGGNARLAIDSRTWDFSLDGTATIDLMRPTNATVSTDSTETRWPLPTVDGPLWGVTAVALLTFENLTPETDYTITSIQLLRQDHSAATLLCQLPSGKPAWYLETAPVMNDGGTTTATRVRRFLDGDTDGRRGLEQTDVVWIETTGGISGVVTDTYAIVSLSQLAANVNGNGGAYPTNGWSAVDPAPTDIYLNNAQPARWAEGGGLIWIKRGSDSAPQWHAAFDYDATGTVNLSAQGLYDRLTDWQPETGDLFYQSASSVGEFGGPANLHAGTILRAASSGLVWNGSGAPEVGVTVTAKLTAGSESAGSGTSDTFGEYRDSTRLDIGTPYGKGGRSYDVAAAHGSLPYPYVRRTYTTRTRHRASFSAVDMSPIVRPFALHRRAGPYYRVALQASDVYFWSSDAPVPLGWLLNQVRVTTTADCADPRLTLDLAAPARLSCIFARPSGIFETISDDEGATWNMPYSIITDGTRPTVHTAPDGSRLTAAYVGPSGGPGEIQAIWQSTGDPSPSTSFTLVDDTGTPLSASDDSFHITQGHEGPGRWVLVFVVAGETSPSEWTSADVDGESWTRTT